MCKECKGSQVCVHDNIKYNCKQCKGKVYVSMGLKRKCVKNVILLITYYLYNVEN